MNRIVSEIPVPESVRSAIRVWIEEFGEEVEREIMDLVSKKEYSEIEDRFYKRLEFGTGGMRGKMAIGPNRMNKYTVRMATQGVVNYLRRVKPDVPVSFVVGFDTRRNSYQFALETARVLVANKVKCYFIKIPMPTPFVSFAIRYLKTDGGVIITASHNPPDYNGYKVYWDDGAQVVSPNDKGIIEEVYKITSAGDIKVVSDEELYSSPLFVEVLEDVKNAYLRVLRVNLGELCGVEELERRKTLNIGYTPLHGTSINLTIDALRSIGFENIFLVEEECTMEGDFSAVPTPNPEDDSTFARIIDLSKKVGAEVFFASDPDADRVRAGIIENGEPILFSGNQLASMMLYWILSKLSEKGALPENGFVVTTIVTTDLIRKIATSFGVETFLTLTGFKYIGEKIRQFEGKKRFIFGCEESIGYLYGDDVRDKDSVISTCILSLMVEDLMRDGRNLKDYLMDIYTRYGVHIESLVSLEFEGVEGSKKIEAMMEKVKDGVFEEIGGFRVLSRIDLRARTVEYFPKGVKEEYKTDLPPSSVVIISLEGANRVIVRPSGTEPKVKIYFFSEFDGNIENMKEYKEKHNSLVKAFMEVISA